MDSDDKTYDHVASFKRIDDILKQPDVNYEEVKELPDRDRLTFTNGFYAYCSALFIDIRGSSDLPAKYKRPTLARLYRAYISECVAIMNADLCCREINIVGDGVWCVVNTPKKSDIDDVFSTAANLNSMIKTFNYKLGKRGIGSIRVGIGMDQGRQRTVLPRPDGRQHFPAESEGPQQGPAQLECPSRLLQRRLHQHGHGRLAQRELHLSCPAAATELRKP